MIDGAPLIQEYDSPAIDAIKMHRGHGGSKVKHFHALMHHESMHHSSINSKAQITSNSRESVVNTDLDAVTAKFDIESNANRDRGDRMLDTRQIHLFQSFQDSDNPN